ncbi:MAG: urease accessory protein UreE [Pseudomonadota bacterium]
MSIPRATRIDHGEASDSVALDYEGRFLRRRRLVSAMGRAFLVDLAETRSLDQGDVFLLDDGSAIAIKAAPEPLYHVTGENLARLAWHIGNRHTPARIETTRIVIRADHVLKRMLEGLGAHVTEAVGPFQPEGGAYGTGRTLGHSHGHDDETAQGHSHE